ncbi:hypothetical protein KI688_000391 [Linnemannia hyalina]|uniref:Uncharacterized protein n=1 Tax=Linnemannia hyalina TaxID=64524 RepID=A0A9P7Y450_9FUNG|nr:hypothetical protein KI688_000391 [Linnemannia hyalina]
MLCDDGWRDPRSGHETRVQDADHQMLAPGVECTEEDQKIDSRLQGRRLTWYPFKHTHINKPVNTLFSSQQDTRLRSRGIKKVHEMLPTMDVLRARRPDLYKDDLCRLCGLETEDNEHIWACSKSRETQEELWEDALDRVDGWGEIATRQFNKQRQKQLKPGKQSPPETVWRIPRTSKLRKALW